jgi:hypothetical protein
MGKGGTAEKEGMAVFKRQADGSARPTGLPGTRQPGCRGLGGEVLRPGGLDEPTAEVEFDVDCDADVILCCNWLRAYDLVFLYETAPASPGSRMFPNELREHVNLYYECRTKVCLVIKNLEKLPWKGNLRRMDCYGGGNYSLRVSLSLSLSLSLSISLFLSLSLSLSLSLFDV